MQNYTEASRPACARLVTQIEEGSQVDSSTSCSLKQKNSLLARSCSQIRKIGAGSFGSAYLCRDERTGEKVVIKRVSVKDMPEEEKRAARREAEILRHLKHPGILRHIESFESDGFLCLVTEFCERGDLSQRIASRGGVLLPEATVMDYFTQMLLALLYIHKRKAGAPMSLTS